MLAQMKHATDVGKHKDEVVLQKMSATLEEMLHEMKEIQYRHLEEEKLVTTQIRVETYFCSTRLTHSEESRQWRQ